MSTHAPTTATADGMIEFPCYGCGRALKVPGSAAGKQAKCPQCNAVQTVPQGTTSPAVAGMQTMQPPPPMSFAPTPPAEAPISEPAKPPAEHAVVHVEPVAPKLHEGRDTPTRRLFDRMTEEIAKIYVGQDELGLGALTALFS